MLVSLTPLRVLGACAITLSAFAASTASATVIVSDSFNYPDTAAMQAVWGATGLGTLDTTQGNPANSAAHPGGADNSIIFPAVFPTDAKPLSVSVDIRDDGTTPALGKRITLGVRSTDGVNIVELGEYNDPGYYMYRNVNFDTGETNWQAFDTTASGIPNAPAARWNRFTAVIRGTSSTYTLDIGADGSIDASATVAEVPDPAGINQIRFGGPSSLSSAAPGNFDNILLQVVPEPTSLALLPLAALALKRITRRAN